MIIDIYLNEVNKGTPDNYHAKGTYNTDTNVTTILQGSKWKTTQGGSLPRNLSPLRDKLINNGDVDSNGVFQRNVEIKTKRRRYTSLSPAASLIANGASSGIGSWQTDVNGISMAIGDHLKEIGVFNADGRYVPPASVFQSICENEEQIVSDSLKDILRKNIIFYGVPGCGKSHYINELLGLYNGDETGRMPAQYYKRILFHPEYSYSEFVGQTMPQATPNGGIQYKFCPGPFVEILCDAYLNREQKYFLIIEEINRGNAPAIFGDLFQLLDRTDAGKSEYGIYNKDILEQLEQVDPTIEEVRIPENLTILATMNTCDQNVFTLDTAFKRRWIMKRIKNDFDNDDFSKTSLAKTEIVSGSGITWKEFGKAVNDAIVTNCNDGTSTEDKQLGTYFVRESEAKDPEIFAEKVMMYLWDDVAKYDKSQLFDTKLYPTLDSVIDGFVNGKNVFSESCEKLYKLYENPNQP